MFKTPFSRHLHDVVQVSAVPKVQRNKIIFFQKTPSMVAEMGGGRTCSKSAAPEQVSFHNRWHSFWITSLCLASTPHLHQVVPQGDYLQLQHSFHARSGKGLPGHRLHITGLGGHVLHTQRHHLDLRGHILDPLSIYLNV